MPKIQSFILRDFSYPSREEYHIEVPISSIFKKCMIIPTGVIAIYEVPSVEIKEFKFTEKFKILENNEDVPDNSTYIDVLEAISENADKEQIVILLPIYKLN